MKLYFTVTRKFLILITAILILTVAVAGELCSIAGYSNELDGATNALRVEFATSLGYKINESAIESKKIIIPETFSDVYENYNKIQKQAGYDLSLYKGSEAVVYIYRVENQDGDEVHMNLIVVRGRIVGGDVCSVRLDGFMVPLIPREKAANRTSKNMEETYGVTKA